MVDHHCRILELIPNGVALSVLFFCLRFSVPRQLLARNCYYINGSKYVDMKKPTIRQVKKAKAVFGVITAIFSLAVALQQMIHLKQGKTAQA
jgi:hypothetical protein